jgi:hypothetical protein
MVNFPAVTFHSIAGQSKKFLNVGFEFHTPV